VIPEEYKPKILDKTKGEKLLSERPRPVLIDAFGHQLEELFFIDNPKFIGEDKIKVYKSNDFANYSKKKSQDFIFVYYPWNYHLVKCVQKDDYFALKTNRNKDLITLYEQERLSGFSVAVLGLSVGSNIAFALTQSGISQQITIADYDELDTTNLNRIIAGVHQIGLNKTIVTARRIYEDNPFANVQIFPKGINKENLEKLLEGGSVDCIIDEVDDVLLKIDVRRLAMKYKVPVVMVTDNGDGIVLSIERYELGCQTILHREVSRWAKITEEFEKGKSKELSGKIIIEDIVGGAEHVDLKMMASVKRVLNKELISWSQLEDTEAGLRCFIAIHRKNSAMPSFVRLCSFCIGSVKTLNP